MLMTNWMMVLAATSDNTGFAVCCVRLNGSHFAEARKRQAKFVPPSGRRLRRDLYMMGMSAYPE